MPLWFRPRPAMTGAAFSPSRAIPAQALLYQPGCKMDEPAERAFQRYIDSLLDASRALREASHNLRAQDRQAHQRLMEAAAGFAAIAGAAGPEPSCQREVPSR